MGSPIVLCSDGSDLSLRALTAGVALLGSDRPYVVVTITDEPDPSLVTGTGMAGGVMSQDEFERSVANAASNASTTVESVKQSLGLADAEIQVLQGSPGPAICKFASDVSAAAIVVGSRGHGGIKRAVLGSVSDHVVRNAPCAVIVTGDNS